MSDGSPSPKEPANLQEWFRQLGEPVHVLRPRAMNGMVIVALLVGFVGSPVCWLWTWLAPSELLFFFSLGFPVISLAFLILGWSVNQFEVLLCPGGLIFRRKRLSPSKAAGGLLAFPWRRLFRIVHVVDGTTGATSHLTLTSQDTSWLKIRPIELYELEGVLPIIRSEVEQRGVRWETEVWTPKRGGFERHSMDSEEQRLFYEERDGTERPPC
jgi:hypothetical protein